MNATSIRHADRATGRPEPLPDLYRTDAGHIRAALFVAYTALLVGATFGPLQALDKMGINLYRYLPLFNSYYQGVTLHGVLLVLVWTFFFNIAFLSFVTVHGLRRPLYSTRLGWVTFSVALAGLLLAAGAILTNNATVLYTFYAPLQAHWTFYLGVTLLVVATWLASVNGFLSLRAWRREHPGERAPLMTFAAMVTWAMWDLASLGLAAALLVYFLPWSLGLTKGISPTVTRSLFWFTGHPLVYFWLLPAYIPWYFMLPAEVGGRLFSGSLARLAFLLFIPLIPTGLHHQFTDPGITTGAKLVQAALTFGVLFPSLLTAFTVLASVEDGARRRGGRGWLLWLLALPWWSEPSPTAQLLAMLLFAGGGITGLINASYNVNLIVHNSMWVPGHLHLQVGTAVTLSFMGVSYWLVPLLTGKELVSKRWGVVQVWAWFFGMAIMARGMHWLGLEGAPRRTFLSMATFAASFPQWRLPGILVGVGGVILYASLLLFIALMAATAFASRRPASVQVPEAVPLHEEEGMPLLLDRIQPWVALALVLIAIAFVPELYRMVTTYPANVAGRVLW